MPNALAQHPPRTLLVVEDQDDLREILVTQARALGYQCFDASDGLAALDIVVAEPAIHAVLCDIQMPNLGGLDLLALMRSRGRDIPFVFLSGYGSEQHLRQAVRLGAYDFLSKPFTATDLDDVISRVLEVGARRAVVHEHIESLLERFPDAAKELEEIRQCHEQTQRLQVAGLKRRA